MIISIWLQYIYPFHKLKAKACRRACIEGYTVEVMHCWSYIVRHADCVSCILDRAFQITYCMSCIVCHAFWSYISGHALHVVQYMQFIVDHSLHVIHCTSHIASHIIGRALSVMHFWSYIVGHALMVKWSCMADHSLHWMLRTCR